jgi:hypothetical protein
METPAAHVRFGRHKGELTMITMIAARLLCVLAVLAPVVLALQPTQAAAQALAVEMARVVDDGTNLLALPIVRLGTTERLYLRGADLAIVNSGACSLLAKAERLECLEKLSGRDIAPPPMSLSPD